MNLALLILQIDQMQRLLLISNILQVVKRIQLSLDSTLNSIGVPLRVVNPRRISMTTVICGQILRSRDGRSITYQMSEMIYFYGWMIPFGSCSYSEIRLSVTKCDLYLNEVTWCGRTICYKGLEFDREYIKSIENLEFQKTFGDLQQFIL